MTEITVSGYYGRANKEVRVWVSEHVVNRTIKQIMFKVRICITLEKLLIKGKKNLHFFSYKNL